MKIAHITIYPPKGEKHSSAGGVASYSKNLITNISVNQGDESFVLCNKLNNVSEEYQEDNLTIVRCFDKSIKFIFQIIKATSKIKPNVVHIQQELNVFGGVVTAYFLHYLMIFFQKIKKIRVVITLHGVVSLKKINKEFVKENNSNLPPLLVKIAFYVIYRPLCIWSDKIIVHYDIFKNILINEYKVSPEKIEVIYHGVEDFKSIDRGEACNKLELDSNKFLVLFMGYATGYKGIDLLIEGFAEYTKTNKNAYLVIGAGKHPKLKDDEEYLKDYRRLQDKAKEMIPEGQYRWVGFIDEKDITVYYSACDLSVYPYTMAMSSSGPMAIAIGHEKPFLASDAFIDILDRQFVFEKKSGKLSLKIKNFFENTNFYNNKVKKMREERLWKVVSIRTFNLYKKIKILLIGTHGQKNIGDDLLLETFLTNLGVENKYFVNSYNPTETKNENSNYDLISFHTTKNPWLLFRSILSSDILFFAGGSILKELKPSIGRNKYSSMVMILILVVAYKIFNRKKYIVMSNIGIGSVKTKLGKLVVKTILKLTNFKSFRDSESVCFARTLLKDKTLIEVPDPVFFYKRKRDVNKKEKDVIKLAVNLNFDVENEGGWEIFLENLAKAISIFSKKSKGIEIIGLPMQSYFKEKNDHLILDELKNKLNKLGVYNFTNKKLNNKEEVIRIMEDCDLVICERFHGLVLSVICKKPALALIYDNKVNSLVKYLGIDEYSIDINMETTAELIAEKINKTIIDKIKIENIFSEKGDELKIKIDSYFNYLRNEIINK